MDDELADRMWRTVTESVSGVVPVLQEPYIRHEGKIAARMSRDREGIDAEFREVLRRDLGRRMDGVPMADALLITYDLYVEFLTAVVVNTWPRSAWAPGVKFIVQLHDPQAMADHMQAAAERVRRAVREN